MMMQKYALLLRLDSPESTSSDFLSQIHSQQHQYTVSLQLPSDPSLNECTHQLDGYVSVMLFQTCWTFNIWGNIRCYMYVRNTFKTWGWENKGQPA